VCTQVADFRKTSGAQARCGLCFSSAARPRQLTIAIGHTAYLALPAGCAPRCMCAGRLMSGAPGAPALCGCLICVHVEPGRRGGRRSDGPWL